MLKRGVANRCSLDREANSRDVAECARETRNIDSRDENLTPQPLWACPARGLRAPVPLSLSLRCTA